MYGKTQVFESCGFLMVEMEIYTNPRHRIINFSDHRKGMGKLKEFASYEFLSIFGVKYVESFKYGKSEFTCYKKKYGKACHIIGFLKIFRVRQMLTIPKTCGK